MDTPDLMICNYVYEHTEDGTSHTVRYTNIFPQERLFTLSGRSTLRETSGDIREKTMPERKSG